MKCIPEAFHGQADSRWNGMNSDINNKCVVYHSAAICYPTSKYQMLSFFSIVWKHNSQQPLGPFLFGYFDPTFQYAWKWRCNGFILRLKLSLGMNVHEPGDFVEAVKPVLYAIANAILFFFGVVSLLPSLLGFCTLCGLFLLLLFSHLMIFELRKGYFMEYWSKKCNFLWLLKCSGSTDFHECTDIFRHHVNVVSENLAEGWMSANLVRDYRTRWLMIEPQHTRRQRHTWVVQLCDGFRLKHNESSRLSSCISIPMHYHKCHGVFN